MKQRNKLIWVSDGNRAYDFPNSGVTIWCDDQFLKIERSQRKSTELSTQFKFLQVLIFAQKNWTFRLINNFQAAW